MWPDHTCTDSDHLRGQLDERRYVPSGKGFPDVPGHKFNIDTLCQVRYKVGVTVDEWRVVDGVDMLFLEWARLVRDTLTCGLPSSIPPARYNIPRVADLHLLATALGDVVQLLWWGEICGWFLWGCGRRHEGDGVDRMFALFRHIDVDIVDSIGSWCVVGGTDRRCRAGALRDSSLEGR